MIKKVHNNACVVSFVMIIGALAPEGKRGHFRRHRLFLSLVVRRPPPSRVKSNSDHIPTHYTLHKLLATAGVEEVLRGRPFHRRGGHCIHLLCDLDHGF